MIPYIHPKLRLSRTRGFILFATLAVVLGCLEQGKIVFVDSSRLMAGTKSLVKVKDSLTVFDALWKKNDQGIKDSVDKYLQEIQQKGGGRTQKEIEASKAEFSRRQQDLNKYAQAIRNKAVELEKS